MISTDQRYEYVIQGTVVDRVTRAGVQGVKIEAWDRDTRYHDMLGVATTDANGRFTIGFQTAYFGDYAPDRSPDVFFKAFLGEREMLSTFETPMMNVERGTTTVTLELQLPTIKNKGVDRIDGLQALKALNWWGQSDFRGVWEQGKDKSKTMGKLLGNMGEKSLSRFNVKPIRPSATTDSQIVNQTPLQAEKTLAMQNIQVTEVKQVSAGSRDNLINLKDYPLALKAGDRVTLYEENGVVKYYTRTPHPKAAGVDAVKVAGIDSDMQTMKAQMRDIDSIRAEMERLKENSQATGQMLGDGSKETRAQAEELSKMRNELAILRKNTAEKDAQLAKFRTDLDMIRTAQTNQTTNIPMSRLEALEAEIVRLRTPERVVAVGPVIVSTINKDALSVPKGKKTASKSGDTASTKAAAKKTTTKASVATKPPTANISAGKSADSNTNIRKSARKPKDTKGGKG
jgi:hypothetical protein